MTCPLCQSPTQVLDSCLISGKNPPRGAAIATHGPLGVEHIRRRRQCTKCQNRFTTYESAVDEADNERLDDMEERATHITSFILGRLSGDRIAEIDGLRGLVGITATELSEALGFERAWFSNRKDQHNLSQANYLAALDWLLQQFNRAYLAVTPHTPGEPTT